MQRPIANLTRRGLMRAIPLASIGRHLRPGVTVAAAAVLVLSAGGCVRRTLTITSEPPGALVMLNDREVGRTPVEVEFLWYGTYDVRLNLEGHEPLVTSADVRPPLYDTLPLDLIAEASPMRHEVRRAWHFTLEPAIVDDGAVLERARLARQRIAALPPIDSDSDSADRFDSGAGSGADVAADAPPDLSER